MTKSVFCNLHVPLPVTYFHFMLTEGKSRDELVAEEEEEEEEAKKIQKRLAEHLSEEDYDLNFFQVFVRSPITCWEMCHHPRGS